MSDAPPRETITILGATGSVGTSTLEILAGLPERFAVEAVTAHRSAGALAELAIRHKARFAALSDPSGYADLKAALAGTGIEVGAGPASLVEAADRPADRVMAAIVGAAGLAPALAAVNRGAVVLLANKECLVCAGAMFMDAARRSGATILPVDSEHSAIFQALADEPHSAVEMVTLTASGGPFRDWPEERLLEASPQEAVRHPNWSMGAKISVDSATMMNKGLELIEAHHLFDLPPDRLEVLVHRESVVHGLVAFVDGAVIAQLAPPDMRTPISYSLAWPERLPIHTERLNLARLGRLTFEAPDTRRFPALALARAALETGRGATTVLNAANEEAVDGYLKNRIQFPDIARIVEDALNALVGESLDDPMSLEDALALDAAGREWARAAIPARLVRAV